MLYGRNYHDRSDDEAEGEERLFQSYNAVRWFGRVRAREDMMRDVPCIFELEEGRRGRRNQ